MCFDDGLAWLMQVTMFLMLGLQVFLARLVPIAQVGLLIFFFLIFVAPLRVSTRRWLFRRFRIENRLLLPGRNSVGPCRLSIATFPLLARIKQADTIFHIVFFIAVTSVVMQG